MSDSAPTTQETHHQLAIDSVATSTNADGQEELTSAIDSLLSTVGSKFSSMSKDIMTQMDAMAARLDELEAQAKASIQAETKRDSGGS
jgi:hypothetical protein